MVQDPPGDDSNDLLSVKFGGDTWTYELLLNRSLEDPDCLRRFACELRRRGSSPLEQGIGRGSSGATAAGESVNEDPVQLLHHLYL
jgi:hypothetical protein